MYEFTEEEIQRYSRHILLREVGAGGQERIRRGSVLVVGAGGLGSPAAMYLAAAGVGRIGIADADRVDYSNLQRQLLHATPDVGRPKVESARDRLRAINPGVRVEAHEARFCAANALELVGGYDFVIDGTDNFTAKFLINDACVMAGKPFAHGGVLRFEGQAFTHLPGTSCLRCLYGAAPPPGAVPTCAQAGVLGPVAGMIGAVEAAEALKYLTGAGEPLTDRLLTLDALAMQFHTIAMRRDAGCPVCGSRPTVTALADEHAGDGVRRAVIRK